MVLCPTIILFYVQIDCRNVLPFAAAVTNITALHKSSTVYYVIPDDDYTTNNNTYTLQHYLNNINKYFTSHTQLHFLPGQYYLNTDLIIQNVSNLSLIGNRTNEVINSVIKCTLPAGIAVVSSSNIVIANLVMKDCGSDFKSSVVYDQPLASEYKCRSSLLVLNSLAVTCSYFHSRLPSGIKFINSLSNITIVNVVSTYLSLWNEGIRKSSTLTIHIDNFVAHNAKSYKYAIDLHQIDSAVDTVVILSNTQLKNKRNM